MAELRKIVKSPQLSNFRQAVPESGGLFRNLALGMETAYEAIKPAAMQQATAEGDALGREMARRQIGDPLAGVGTQGNYRKGIQAIESGGNYSAIGPTTKSGDKAYGAYQVMGKNVGPWTEKHFGKRLTPQEFLANKEAQDAVFDGEFGSYVSRFGNSQDAASMWFSGRPLDKAGNASDGYTTVPDYVKKFTAASGGDAPATTLVRTSDGNLEGRLYSPMSGEILQAHNAAAGVAYASGVMVKGVADLMAMSNEFSLDPAGFRDAGRAYVDDLVKAAPEQFRPDIRNSLEKELTRRVLGVTEDQQSDIRKRADNSSAALVERWQSNLAEAMASGNKDEIDSARSELDGLLVARENLPGLAWTPEQSANVFIDAQKQAERLRASAAKRVDDGNKDKLRTIIKAAEGGMHGADEAILSDPAIAASNPDLWAEAVGKTALRDWLPSFNSATPAQMAATAAQMANEPISNDVQLYAVKAAQDAAKASKAAWDKDPIAQAEAVLPNKPPPLPSLDSSDPKAFVDALSARHAYALKLQSDGYVDHPAFLSNTEAETIGTLMGKDMDPVAKSLISSAIVQGFGDDAVSVFKEIKSNDPVTIFSGMYQARGGDPATATLAIAGQQALDAKLVQGPGKATLPETVTAAISSIPNAINNQAGIVEFATALYAGQAQGVDPKSEAAKKLWDKSVQMALGQSEDRRGRVTGGIQAVGGQDVFLPIGVSGVDADLALKKALGGDASNISLGAQLTDSLWNVIPGTSLSNSASDAERRALPDVWKAAGPQGVPMLGGEQVPLSMIKKGLVRMVPSSGSTYRMEVVINGQPASDIRDAAGNVFFFDLEKLIEAAK